METEAMPAEAGPVEVPSVGSVEEAPAEGPALPSDPSTEDIPSDEPAEEPSSSFEEEEEPARDWESELAELASERDSLTAERDDLTTKHQDAESRVNELLAEVEALKARLLHETLSSVQAEIGSKVSEPHMQFVDKSALADENGLPNRDAVRQFVELFSVKRFERSASDLHVGAQTSGNQPDPNAGFEGRTGSRLDARNRSSKFNPFGRK
ncbi:hypothetical protein ABT299_20165 [Spirillospora sp. NPDC000708]